MQIPVCLRLDKLLHERHDGSQRGCPFHQEECLGGSHQGLCSAGSAATSTTSTPTPSCAMSAGTAASRAASTAAAPPPCWGFPPWGVPWTRGLPCQLSRKLPTLPTTRLRCCRRVSRELTSDPEPQQFNPYTLNSEELLAHLLALAGTGCAMQHVEDGLTGRVEIGSWSVHSCWLYGYGMLC